MTTPPTGVGLYIRTLSTRTHGTPDQAAKKAADNGISFVAILACWQDKLGHREPHSTVTLARYAHAFKRAGVDVWLWGFPKAGSEEQFVESFQRLTRACDGYISGWLFDPEVFYKWRQRGAGGDHGGTMRTGRKEYSIFARPLNAPEPVIRERAKLLMSSTLDAMDESLGLGVTSYGATWFHDNFPWSEFGGHGWGSPQLYSAPKDMIDRGIQSYRDYGWDTIIPSVPTFGDKSGRLLDDHLHDFIDGNDIHGIIAWSWRQTSAIEWWTLAQYAEYFASK